MFFDTIGIEVSVYRRIKGFPLNRTSLIAGLILIAFESFSQPHPVTDDIPVKEYELFWADEFSGSRLDLSRWNIEIGKRRDAFNSAESVQVDGKGYLRLVARKKGDSLFAAMINSQYKFETRHGYFECRAKLTNSSGLWPAFWLNSGSNGDYGTPERNGVEIDVMEYFVNQRPDAVSHNLHWGGYGPTHQELGSIFSPLKPTTDGFHKFGLEWTEHSYTAYVDGIQTASGRTQISNIPEFIILSVEIDAKAAGPLQTSALPDSFVIDYVRVYKKKKVK
jgi:beta-glucanase (GH16 family)